MSLPKPRAASSSITKVTNLVIALVLIMFGVYAVDSWQQYKRREDQHMQSSLLLLSRTLEVFFTSKRAGMMSLSEAIERTRGGLGDLRLMQQLLSDYKRHRPELSLTFLTDMSGQMLASSHTRGLTNLPSLADQPAFQDFLSEHANETDVYLGRPQVGKLTGQWAFSMRYVLRDGRGKPLAVLTDVFPTQFLESLWKDAPLVSHLTVGILRDDGYLLTRYPLPDGVQKEEVFGSPRTGALRNHLVQEKFPVSGRVVGPNALSKGEDFINLFQRLDRFPVTVFIAQPQRQVLSAWVRTIATPLLFTILLLGFVKLASIRLVRQERERIADKAAADDILRTSEAEQRLLIDNLMTGLVIHAASGEVLRCNIEATKLLGLTPEQMSGKQLIDPAWHFVNEDGSVMAVSDYPVSRVLLTRQAVRDLVLGIVRAEGAEICWVLCRADPWFNATGDMDRIVVTFFDITFRRKLTSEVRDRELQFQALFENSMDAVMLTDPKGGVLAANPAACQLFGLTESEIIARGRAGLVDHTDPQLQVLLARRQQTVRAGGTLTMIRGDGTRFTAEITSSIYTDSNGSSFGSMIVRDITERQNTQAALEAANSQMQRVNAQLMEMAHYDTLTHLPNRALLTDRMQQAIAHSVRRNRSVAIAFLDLDGFKDINDQYGHDVGDRFLVGLSLQLKAELREGDTLSRLGGDEFVAVLTDLGDELDCEPMLRRLLKSAATPVMVEGHVLHVTASIGVTIFPRDGATPEVLLRHADQAMYMAKQAGKNRYHLFDVESDTAVRNRRSDLQRVERALRAREFVLHYQPQVNMRTGEVIGVEALIRWNHPERGLLAPGAFLPLIEDEDIAVTVGSHVLEMALQQLTDWSKVGLKLRVGVNIFARQLQDARFVEHLQSLMADFPSLDPSLLELEVVETSALLDIEEVSRLMQACAELGVHFALDDFGTGYSSLTYLKRLPADLLKIDQSFVRDMLEDHDDLAIVEGVIGLAHAFSRKVIAEGVETVEHARLLLSKGCELGQGYGIARPMPAEELPQWIAIWKARQPWVVTVPGAVTTP